jgi:hypothetical protein
MTIREAEEYLTEAVSVLNLESFLVFGGEPMLYADRAIAAFKRANQLGIPKIEMLTNGVWGKNKEQAEKLASKMKTAGLNILGVSVDAFHLQYIPLEWPRNAALASVKAGIDKVSWNVAVLESVDAANEYDRKTKDILKTLEPAGIEAHMHKVGLFGRATKELSHYFQPTSLDGPCEGEPILDSFLKNPECITIEPSGEVDVCWNLSVGNAKEKSLSQIIGEYDWRRHSMIKTLVEEGPMGLVKIAEKRGRRFQKDRFVNKCHLCIGIREVLKKRDR